MLKRRVLVVAAHADDEVLGCGGSLIRHSEDGADIAAIFLTNGVGSRDSAGEPETSVRDASLARAMKILGVCSYTRLEFPDNALDTVSLLSIAKAVEAFCEKWGCPDIVYTHHPGDLNIDHQLAHRAVMTTFRPQPSQCGCPAQILSFEVLSSTGWRGSTGAIGFLPNYYVDISSTLERKLQALNAYSQELRAWPHARSAQATEHLARFRGAIAGLEAAEAFCVERIIVINK